MLLSILTRTLAKITDEPGSYNFVDYATCLVGHVYFAATGRPYVAGTGVVFTPVDLTTPFGDAILAIFRAHAMGEPDLGVTPADISHVNHCVAKASAPAGYDPTNDEYREAAIKVLETTIGSLGN